MSTTTCPHASSGCDYPAGECSGACAMALTPQVAAEKAEQLIGQYVRELGAYGDRDKVRQVLIMLISKAALGIECVAGLERTTKILMETALNVSTVVDQREKQS